MSGLIPPAILSLTTTSLKNEPKMMRNFPIIFCMDTTKKGGEEEAYLQVKKSKIARSDFKELKAAIRASYRNTVIMGTVFYHDDKKTFEFRSQKPPVHKSRGSAPKKRHSLSWFVEKWMGLQTAI